MGEETGKVHVGNLSYKITEDEIRDAFEKYGLVTDVNIIIDRDTGRAKGFAFVTFKDTNDARDAIEGLDNTDLNGRNIKVNKATPRGRSYRGGGRSGGYGDRSSGYGDRQSRYSDRSGGYGDRSGGYGDRSSDYDGRRF